MEPEDVDGVDAIQLKVNLKSADFCFIFIDPGYLLSSGLKV